MGAITQGIAVAFVAAQKIYFSQPRPYFIDASIPVDCNFIDYGAPSAHTSLAISSWGTIWAISVKSTNASPRTKLWTFCVFLLPLIIYTPISRVYVGNHSLDQVLIGAMQGILVLLMCVYVLEQDVSEWFRNIHRQSFWRIIIHPTSLFVILTNLLMIYLLKQHTKPIPQLWVDNIESRCGTLEPGKKDPDGQSFELCLLAIGNLGNAVGVYFEHKLLPSHVYKNWNQTDMKKRTLRFIYSLFAVPLAFYSGSFLFKTLFTPIIGQKRVYLWKRAVLFFTGNFHNFGLLRWGCYKLNLINTEIEEEPKITPTVKQVKPSPSKGKKKAE